MHGIDGVFQAWFGTDLRGFIIALALIGLINWIAWEWVAKKSQVIRYAFGRSPWYRRIAGLIDLAMYIVALMVTDALGIAAWVAVPISLLIGCLCGLVFVFACGSVLIERLRTATIQRMIDERTPAQ